MFVKSYENLSSSAIFGVKCDKNVINVTYQSILTRVMHLTAKTCQNSLKNWI